MNLLVTDIRCFGSCFGSYTVTYGADVRLSVKPVLLAHLTPARCLLPHYPLHLRRVTADRPETCPPNLFHLLPAPAGNLQFLPQRLLGLRDINVNLVPVLSLRQTEVLLRWMRNTLF